MNIEDKFKDQPFDFRETKEGTVLIAYRNKTVTTLKGTEAARFLAKASSSDESGQQLLMAKATGHFKHGNEKAAKQKRR